jgi:cardiolipin synthase
MSWQEGNRITLLENGDEYYPALFAAIDNAQQRVILETFIWFEDDVGKQLHACCCAARAASKLRCCSTAMARRISAMSLSAN